MNYWAIKAYFAAIDHSIIQDKLRRAIRRGEPVGALVLEYDRCTDDLRRFSRIAEIRARQWEGENLNADKKKPADKGRQRRAPLYENCLDPLGGACAKRRNLN